jgi:O-antigen ligase
VSRLSSAAVSVDATLHPARDFAPVPSVRTSVLAIAAFACGAAFRVKLDVVGEIYLIEPLILLLTLQCLFARGLGKGFVAPVFLGFLGAGLLTFCGYLLADLIAANEPWQYLKGWGRVLLLVLDSMAMIVLAAHGRQNIWWIALGIGVGGLASLLLEGVPLTQWKIGYGEYLAILLMALAPLAPSWLAGVLIGAFGALSIALDYRSLGAACLVVAAIMLWRHLHKRETTARNWLFLSVMVLTLATSIALLLSATQQDYLERREQSNVGRYVGLIVAWRAIAESPLIGYGSWAADRNYGRMMRNEAQRMNRDRDHPIEVSESLLPHSQFLQAWVEGGLPGTAFFVFFGIYVAGALRWFALRRPVDAITPLALYFLILGLWNLAASPFLGIMRIYIAMAVGIVAVAACERR